MDTLIAHQGFSPESLARGLLGMLALITLAWILSADKKNIQWRVVAVGILMQVVLAIGVLYVPVVQNFFEIVGGVFVRIMEFTKAGVDFLFRSFVSGNLEPPLVNFAIMILPTIVFFSALTSVLFFLGVIQKIVKGLAWLLTRSLGISGAEALSVAGNIFLGQTEAPLMIKKYLAKMNRSEIFLVMVGGMATVAGGVLAAYVAFLGGDDPAQQIFFAKHLLAASVMAAPGAIVVAKILLPQTEPINSNIDISRQEVGINVIDSIATGTTEGLKLAMNVGAMLLVFFAFIAMFDHILGWIGGFTGLNDWIQTHTIYDKLSLGFLLGYTFAPLMWLIGVVKDDIILMGQLLGVKLIASEFVAYDLLAKFKDPGNPLSLQHAKSVIMATYMLCGFANFASIGIQVGGIGSLAPTQRTTLSELGIKALIGGTLASLLSATIAGMLVG